ncbi:hypothetical protein RB595_008796 [Gaeumannomyces hyphopodioides]
MRLGWMLEERYKRASYIPVTVAAGGAGGTLLGVPMLDYLGRKHAVLASVALFLLGCSLQEVAQLGVFYARRLLGGLAIGATSMLAPQYLAEGIETLVKLRGLPEDHAYVAREAMEICAQVDSEQEQAAGSNHPVAPRDVATNASNRRRLFLAVTLFLFHNFTGTDSLNYFAPDIFAMIGVPVGSSSLLTTGVYALVKMATTMVYVTVIVDRATAMLYLALYVRFAESGAAGRRGGGTPAGGIVGIIWIYVYAFGWSFGHSVAPYVVATEIFPPRIRSLCMGVCLFVNWTVDYGITLATPTMTTRLGYGTFLPYVMLTYMGVVFAYLCLPELKGRGMASMDDLFQRSIWTMWRHAYPTTEEKVRHDVQDVQDMLVQREHKWVRGKAAAKAGAQHVEGR